MSKDKTEILQLIKRNFKKEVNIPNHIGLPRDLEFTLIGNDVKFHFSSFAVVQNMQKNVAAFEGWALVLKRWGKFEKIILSWDNADKPEDGHYQRFLFRVKKFSVDFPSWFLISPESQPYLDYLRIKEFNQYYLNSPSKNRNKTEPQNPESRLEKRFSSGEWLEDLKKSSNAQVIYNQLPVGVFENRISAKNSIFTGRKSAIDIWGITNNNELLLFELKIAGNSTIGIISELYFYCCLMRNVQTGMFKHEKSDKDLDRIANTKKIMAFFLTPSLHILIDQKLVAELNAGINPEIEIKYLQFEESSDKIEIRDVF